MYDKDNRFGKWLEYNLKELNITEKDLAKAVGCCTKTITRYKNGDKPSEEKKAKINEYIDKKSCYGHYRHMPSKDFGKYIEKLLANDFKGVITEAELAKRVGLKGGNAPISKITSDSKKTNTELQFKILKELLDLCIRPEKERYYFDARFVYSEHYDTAKELYEYMFGDTKQFDILKNSEKCASYYIVNKIIEYFLWLPYDAQELVINNPLAFFDSMKSLSFDDNNHYATAEAFIERVRSLPHRASSGNIYEKSPISCFQYELEILIAEEETLSYCFFNDDWDLFDMATQYRAMIKSARERRISDPDGTIPGQDVRPDNYEPVEYFFIEDFSDREVQRNEQIKKLETVLTDFNEYLLYTTYNADDFAVTIMRDIEYRLMMSPWDWYMWMLYASHVYTFHDDGAILELLKKYEDMYPSLDDEDDEDDEDDDYEGY